MFVESVLTTVMCYVVIIKLLMIFDLSKVIFMKTGYICVVLINITFFHSNL